MTRAEILNRIDAERHRQLELPGSEFDVRNNPNVWSSIVGHYVFGEVRRGLNNPSRVAFEDNMIKAAAIIVAALENVDAMQSLGYFSDEPSDAMSDFAMALSSVTSRT
jgi:hypothetical protein